MKTTVPIVLTLGMLFLGLASNPVVAGDTQSFRTSLLKLEIILQALDDFTGDSPIRPGDSITYGKLINAGALPEEFCKKSIENQICGTNAVEEEYQNTIGPPLEALDNFGVVRIILPYFDPGTKQLFQLNASITGYPAIGVLLRSEKGKIPLVLYETRKGDLKRLLSLLLRDQATERPSPTRGYHL